MNNGLSRFHQILNSDEVVPAKSYRRNKVIFELVSYLNCLSGCVLNERRDVVPPWIRRGKHFMEKPPAEPDWKKYYAIVQD
jgi:hypothetical protein